MGKYTKVTYPDGKTKWLYQGKDEKVQLTLNNWHLADNNLKKDQTPGSSRY